ncbi:hypothetical protein FACS189413_00130 [Bacteroidia bacterium]|nr:hypothetical protein FACS189413_00130 [Bacteroidia bacterium]
MLKTVSRQTLLLYWDIGKSVSEKVRNADWGQSVVEQLSKDLQYLRDEQVLVMIGKGKGSVYILREEK